MKNLLQWKYDSMIGPLYLVTSDKGLCGLYWEEQKIPFQKKLDGTAKKAVNQLEEYFQGKRKSFDIPFDLIGTSFQLKVWNLLLKIPYGETCTYKQMARLLKNEKAARAVGTANGKNPLCIIVPCHRVIASDGSLSGFSGGLERKRKLLQLETQV